MSIDESDIGKQLSEAGYDDDMKDIEQMENEIVMKNRRSYSIVSKDQSFINRKNDIMENDEPTKLKLELEFKHL